MWFYIVHVCLVQYLEHLALSAGERWYINLQTNQPTNQWGSAEFSSLPPPSWHQALAWLCARLQGRIKEAKGNEQDQIKMMPDQADSSQNIQNQKVLSGQGLGYSIKAKCDNQCHQPNEWYCSMRAMSWGKFSIEPARPLLGPQAT